MTDLFDIEPTFKPSSPDLEQVNMGELMVSVEMDKALSVACGAFDYAFTGISSFSLPKFDAPQRDGSWNIGLIVGPSGSGKSQLLFRYFGEPMEPQWSAKKAIVSQLGEPNEAIAKLSAVGLNSVPSWCRPYHVLSTGEQFRARMAAMLDNGIGMAEEKPIGMLSIHARNVSAHSFMSALK